jgi:hypothetical protein
MGKNKNKRRESPIQEDPQEKKVTITNSHIYYMPSSPSSIRIGACKVNNLCSMSCPQF